MDIFLLVSIVKVFISVWHREQARLACNGGFAMMYKTETTSVCFNAIRNKKY